MTHLGKDCCAGEESHETLGREKLSGMEAILVRCLRMELAMVSLTLLSPSN